ncbi:hypothetical protein ACPA54_29525 [Uniformispora flossi]|uniref:hypothetical protein n=1 Tax=Uniformispora flossi TaxID=3390723 RepID=UPI003C2B4140
MPRGVHSSILLLLCGFGVGWIANRWSAKITLVAGLAVALAGLLVTHNYHYEKWQFIVFGPLFAVGMGLVIASGPVLVVEAVRAEDQATVNGVNSLIGGVLSAISTQVIFSVLNDRANVVQGTSLYTDGGYKAAYTAAAVMLAGALVLALFIPKVRTAAAAAADSPVAAPR